MQGSKLAPSTNRVIPFLRGRNRDRRANVVFGSRLSFALSRSFSYRPCIQNKISDSSIEITKNQSKRMRRMTTNAAQQGVDKNQQSLSLRVFLAVGSNQGDSFANIATGIQLLCDPSFSNSSYRRTTFSRSSFLYLTKPMYVTDQAFFWNGAVELDTDHDPKSLLYRLKLVEEHLGREFSQVRNGPRPLDLDILLCYDKKHFHDKPTNLAAVIMDTPELVIPHSSLQEREFVLAPLIDIAGRELVYPKATSPSTTKSQNSDDTTLGDILDDLIINKSKEDTDNPATTRLIPLPRKRTLLFDETLIMGILNVTPDSFSDGGKWTDSIDRAVERALEMVDEGATIVDIGGESTRPGAPEVHIEKQISRTIPVIEAIRKRSKDIILSIDTRHAAVAKAAVEAGADIVNDVSGGTHDPDMLSTVANLQVPIILMHMRGDPESMQSLTNYDDQGGVVEGVIKGLSERSQAAEEAGIPRWMQILDPGIGFAKDVEGNLLLLKNYSSLRSKIGDFPLVLGTSRKGFIGKLSGEAVAEERDFGTIGSCVTALCVGINQEKNYLGCNILRVHNVKGAKQATVIMDAIVRVS